MTIEIRVPDIGGIKVPVIELLVKPGDTVDKDQGLITLESDKATMDVPASAAGTVRELRVKVGDEVEEGSVIAVLDAEGAADTPPPKTRPAAAAESAPPAKPVPPPSKPAPAAAGAQEGDADIECALLVLGAGPGGYTAAFRAADLGMDVVLVERHPTLGGVCLNVGCIPSKALLHAAGVIDAARAAADTGITFGEPKIDLDRLRTHKDKVVGQLTKGLAGMARQRSVRVIEGEGRFSSANVLEVTTAEGSQRIRFGQAIIATGSRAVKLPGLPWDDPRLMHATGALELADIPPRLLVIGGGIIGLEMATVYAALGSEVTVVELMDQLIPGADADLVKPLHQRLRKQLKAIHLGVKVAEVKARKKDLLARFEGEGAPGEQAFDRVLVAVGRSPNGGDLGAAKAGVEVTDRGFIPVDRQMRTNVPHIFAIGDVVGQPMLAHKASHEAKVAAEAANGGKSAFDARVIPSVAYTDPEVAWVGLTESAAKAEGIEVKVSKFPFAASGRAIGLGRTEGFTKLLFDPETSRILGGAIVGPHAGEMISEIALAIEMGAEAGDIALTIHPHPTLAESVAMAAEIHQGTITDLYLGRKR